MELIRKGQSLKIVFFKYLLSVGLGLGLAIGLGLLTFNYFYNNGFIVPANYTENLLLENKNKLSKDSKLDEKLIPDNTSYVFMNLEGKIIKSNMKDEIKQKAKKFHKGEEISTPSSSFIEIKRPDGYLVINYSIEPHYTNLWMENHFPKINILFAIILILYSFISTLLITIIWAKRLTKQLTPILKASDEIRKQELDFEIGKSNIKEFNDVLNSLDKMKIALSNSLRENWIQEENRRNQISALTHDLKTPISIVKGNAELLKDTELTEEQDAYVDFIIKNSKRISDYSKALMIINKTNQLDNLDLQKVKVSNIVERVRELSEEITSAYRFTLSETINFEDRYMMIDIKLFERLIQNILSNAVEYSKEESTIELRILTTDDNIEVKVLDYGRGFSIEDLKHGTEQFYRGDKSRHSSTNYGLGLYLAKKIVEMHNGCISLANRKDRQGAVVSIKMPLIKYN